MRTAQHAASTGRTLAAPGTRDFAAVAGHTSIDAKAADAAYASKLSRMGFDAMGMTLSLSTVAENYGGGPVGVETLGIVRTA